MTCIVGYKDASGEILLAADNRITLEPLTPVQDQVHVDQLQKIYLPQASLAIAFASNDLAEVKRTVKLVSFLTRFLNRKVSSFARIMKCHDAIPKLFKRVATRTRSEFLVALCFAGRNDLNKLLYFRYENGKLVGNIEDVGAGCFHVGGSVGGEQDSDRFVEQCVASAFKQFNPTPTIWQRMSLFSTFYVNFQRTLDEEWQKIGQCFCLACGDEGQFKFAENESLCVTTKGVEVAYSILFDPATRKFNQVNQKTGESLPLISVLDYDFGRVEHESKVFRVVTHG